MQPGDTTSRLSFVQYGAMAAYESRIFFEQQVGILPPPPMWDPAMAAAARHAGKFFEDTHRHLDGVVDYFARLVEANHEFFFPKSRPARWLDGLRSDLAILLLDSTPVLTNVGGYFLLGVAPSVRLDVSAAGPHVRDLAAGIGQTARWLGFDSSATHTGPVTVEESRLVWRDADTQQALAMVFGGAFEPSLAMAMMTIQGAVSSAHRMARSGCCAGCNAAAFKQRFLVTYQVLLSLQQLHETDGRLTSHGQLRLDAILASAPVRELQSRGYRRLRNGLLHLGLGDVPVGTDGVVTLRDVIFHYTGVDPDNVVAVVDEAVDDVRRGLEDWCLTPPPGGTGLTRVLRKP